MNRKMRKVISYTYDHMLHFGWALHGQQCDCQDSKWQRLAGWFVLLEERFGSYSDAPHAPEDDENASTEGFLAFLEWWDNHEEKWWEATAYFLGRGPIWVAHTILNHFPWVDESPEQTNFTVNHKWVPRNQGQEE